MDLSSLLDLIDSTIRLSTPLLFAALAGLFAGGMYRDNPGELSSTWIGREAPALPERSLGVMALLWQIEQCQRLQLPYLYLGYWINQCQKMEYKSQYRPLEILRSGAWKEFDPD